MVTTNVRTADIGAAFPTVRSAVFATSDTPTNGQRVDVTENSCP